MSIEYVPYGTRIHQVASHNPDELAIIFLAEDGSERRVTWRELDDRSTQMARSLREARIPWARPAPIAFEFRHGPTHPGMFECAGRTPLCR